MQPHTIVPARGGVGWRSATTGAEAGSLPATRGGASFAASAAPSRGMVAAVHAKLSVVVASCACPEGRSMPSITSVAAVS
jgi:hypothetical protein